MSVPCLKLYARRPRKAATRKTEFSEAEATQLAKRRIQCNPSWHHPTPESFINAFLSGLFVNRIKVPRWDPLCAKVQGRLTYFLLWSLPISMKLLYYTRIYLLCVGAWCCENGSICYLVAFTFLCIPVSRHLSLFAFDTSRSHRPSLGFFLFTDNQLGPSAAR